MASWCATARVRSRKHGTGFRLEGNTFRAAIHLQAPPQHAAQLLARSADEAEWCQGLSAHRVTGGALSPCGSGEAPCIAAGGRASAAVVVSWRSDTRRADPPLLLYI